MRKSNAKVSNDKIIEALRKCSGNITAASRLVGYTRTGLHLRIRDDEELKAVLEESRESMIDEAETKLNDLIREGNLGAICFYLKCQGKKRGYVERQEIHVEDEPNPIKVEINVVDAAKK